MLGTLLVTAMALALALLGSFMLAPHDANRAEDGPSRSSASRRRWTPATKLQAVTQGEAVAHSV